MITAASSLLSGDPGSGRPAAPAGQVVFGTCGWSDRTAKWAKGAGAGMTQASDKLRLYSNLGEFGCIEVDTSCYQIPDPKHVAKWVKATPSSFKFCFKAFGWFCARSGNLSSLPKGVRDLLPPAISNSMAYGNCDASGSGGFLSPGGGGGFVGLSSIGQPAVDELWRLFQPARARS